LKKIVIAGLVVVLIGLSVAGYSYSKLTKYARANKATVNLPVPNRYIPPYTLIAPEDITTKPFLKGTEDQNVLTLPGEIIGKINTLPLSPDYPVHVNAVTDPEGLWDLQFVTVNMDVSRAAGARPGDIVDVYSIKTDQQGNWLPENARILAVNAKVVDVTDTSGNSVFSEGKTVQQSVTGIIKGAAPSLVYKLAVRPEEAPGVVPGGAAKSTGIAFTKKFKPSVPVPQAAKEVEQKVEKTAQKPAGQVQKQ